MKHGNYIGGSTVMKPPRKTRGRQVGLCKQATALKPLYLELAQFSMTFAEFKKVFWRWQKHGGQETLREFFQRSPKSASICKSPEPP